MPPAKRDLQLLLVAGGLAVIGGVMLALVLFLSTDRGDVPEEPEPFVYGPADQIEENLRDEGPFYVADPFGGDGSILFALESDEVVAIAVSQRSLPDCSVAWKAQLDRFECGDQRFGSEDLERFEVTVPQSGPNEDQVVVDLRRRLPPPSATTAATTTTTTVAPPRPP